MDKLYSVAWTVWSNAAYAVKWAWLIWLTAFFLACWVIGVALFNQKSRRLIGLSARYMPAEEVSILDKIDTALEDFPRSVTIPLWYACWILILSFPPLIIWTIYDQVIPQRTEHARTYAEVGVDSQGKAARFVILIYYNEYFWKFQDSYTVLNSTNKVVDMEPMIKSDTSSRFSGTSDLIALGTASCFGGEDEESKRSGERAQTLVGWLRHVPLTGHIALYKVNLGKYLDAPQKCTKGDWERRQRVVIVVAVVDKQADVNMEQSLRNALEKASPAIFAYTEINKYSNWTLDKFKLENAY